MSLHALEYWSVENIQSEQSTTEAIVTFRNVLSDLTNDPAGFQRLATTLNEQHNGLLECILSAGMFSYDIFVIRITNMQIRHADQ